MQHRYRPAGEDGKGGVVQETIHDRWEWLFSFLDAVFAATTLPFDIELIGAQI